MLVFAIISGGWVAEPPGGLITPAYSLRILVGLGFIAAVLPVWLLAPRDYLYRS